MSLHVRRIWAERERHSVRALPYGAPVTPLSADAYLTHLRSESARFREVLATCDPAAPVPTCPDWRAADLLWHLATVQRWWAEVLTVRPQRPEEVEPTRPASYDELVAAFDEWSEQLIQVLASADPADEAWNWSADHTVGFILRRQAHEALVHRVDAELAAGVASVVDPVLASDGVHECLDVMFGGCPPWGSWEPGDSVLRVDATDTGEEIWLRFGTFSGTDPDSGKSYAGEEDFHVVPPPEGDDEPAVVIDGPAAALDLWLWSRGDDAEISVVGDEDVHARFRAVVDNPIN